MEHRQVMASSEKSLNKLVAQWGNSLRVQWWQLITVAGEQLSCVSCDVDDDDDDNDDNDDGDMMMMTMMRRRRRRRRRMRLKMMTSEDDGSDDDGVVVDVDDVPHPQARRYSAHNT